MLISYHNAPGHVPCRHWWFLVVGGGIGWSDRVRWNGEVLRKLAITQPMWPRRQSKGYIALGSQLCWAPFEPALSGAHYLYPFICTIGIVVSSVLDRSLILKTLANPLECKYMHLLVMLVSLPSATLNHTGIKHPWTHLSIFIVINLVQSCAASQTQGERQTLHSFSVLGRMVSELSLGTWSEVAGSCWPECRHACLPTGPLGLDPLCAPLPNQATQYAEQPPRWPRCSAPSHWPPLKLQSRAGLSCAQSAGARCQTGWMAEIAMQWRHKQVWIR